MTPRSEISARIAAVREQFDRARVDAILVQDRANTFYLSGFTGTASMILITRRSAHFATDSRYIERVRHELDGYRILKTGKSSEGPFAQLVKRLKLRSIGFERSLPYGAVLQFRKRARPARMKPVRLVEEARVVKSPAEQELLRQAQRAAEKILDTVLGEIRPGMTERAVRNRILRLIDEAGLDGPSFPPIVAAGSHSAIPHHEVSDRAIARNDVVLIDMGVRRQGYCSDMTRTVFVGKPTRQMREVYAVVLDAQERALATVRAGLRGGEVDKAAREVIRKAGYGKQFGHGTGHGVGVEIHEAPSQGRESKQTLKRGACVSVEPGIYLEGRFGVRIEDVVIVGDDGCENLTKASKSLLIL